MKLTAVNSGYFKVRVNGVTVSQHTTEREAIEDAVNREVANPTDVVDYFHDMVVKVEAEVDAKPPVPTPVPVPIPAPTPVPVTPPVVTPVAPPASVTGIQQFQTWDGGSGPSRDYWSGKLKLPWVNPGCGDWLDANLVPQGTTPYATTIVSVGPVGLDVTSLVNRWLSSGLNRGFYLRSEQDWAYAFAGRTNSVVGVHPQLLVVSGSITTTIDCSCNAMWAPSTYKTNDSRDEFSVAKDNQFAALQFDTSTITGPILSATLLLTCLSLKYPGPLEVFELNPPEFRNGSGALPALPGLASAFPFDRGLSSHPDVIFSGDFSDLSTARWQSGGVAAGSSQVLDPNTGSTYLRGLIPKGELWGCDLEWNVVDSVSAGIPAKTETELYGRYYVFLEDDWGSEIDANKMPGWDGRFGWWNSVGYWQNTTGNGGSRPTGLKVRNAAANRWEYEGASMRGHGGTRSNDGNPYDDLFWLGSYIYHLDQEGPFGEPTKWTGVVIGKGRWYCIEQYIKMNSITGPFDEVGNGVAINDGEYRVWVNGVQAYERTNFRWRRHPEMGIQGFWLNWYHGGTEPAPRDMHFRMDSVVVARSYIGPMKVDWISSGLPSWVPAANTVAAIPEVNSFASIDPGDSAANGWSYSATGGPYTGNWHKIIDDFSGGVYNPYYGAKGSMVYHGGGHVANNWNGIVIFDIDTLTYARLMEGCTNCYPADTTNTEYDDGQPMSPHSYDNLVILGPEAGYPKGALITPVRMASAYESYTSTAVHLFDFNNPGAKWTRLAAQNAAFSAQPGGASVYDADLHRVWWVSNINEIGYQQYFDLATNAHVKIWLTYPQSLGSSSPDSKCLRYDSARKLLIHIDSSSDGTTRRGSYFDTTGSVVGWQGITFSTPFPAPSGGHGFAFDRAADGTYLCNVQADLSKIYRLTIPTVLTDPWPVTPITYAGDSLAGAYVLGKRWSYVPALESFVCKPSGAASHQIYRV